MWLGLLVLAAFGITVAGAFVFDDFALFSDSAITSSMGWLDCWRLTQTRPLTWLTFWANYQLGGQQPLGYHLVNLLLHLAVVWLVWDVLGRKIPLPAALIATALFAIHPLLTEPIGYVFSRGTLLAAIFSLLAWRNWVDQKPWRAALWFGVAMLAKEESAALPLFFALEDWSQSRRLRLPPLAAMLGLALAFGLRVIWAIQITPGAWAGAKAGVTPVQYLGAQGPVILRYLRMTVLPWGFSIDPEIAIPSLGVAVAAWALIAILVGFALRYWSVGFWFIAALILLVPSSSIFPASDLAADRRMYLPLVMLSAGAGLLLSRVDRRVVIGLVIAFAAISIRYSALWARPGALWAEAVRLAPNKMRPRIQWARAIRPANGLKVLEEAKSIAPDDPAVYSEMGRILLQMGRADQALGAFGQALALDPGDPMAMSNRGAALMALGANEAAKGDFERALSISPCLFETRLNLTRIGVRSPAPQECRFTEEQKNQLSR